MSQHYGLQSVSDQDNTMIGWGLIAEGYANFGLAGIAGVAAAIGVFLALATRMTVGAPNLSLQNFLGILIMVISLQTELTMVVLVTAILQSAASLLLLLPFCKTQRAQRPPEPVARAKLAIVATHPVQYYAPWFAHLAAELDVELRVFYLWDFGVATKRDPRFEVDIAWDVPAARRLRARIRGQPQPAAEYRRLLRLLESGACSAASTLSRRRRFF